MKALEVSLDGQVIRLCVPPSSGVFFGTLGNVPRKYMRASVTASNDTEQRHWQLPDVQEGQTLSFRMVEVPEDAQGSSPDEAAPRDPTEVQGWKDLGARAWELVKARRKDGA